MSVYAKKGYTLSDSFIFSRIDSYNDSANSSIGVCPCWLCLFQCLLHEEYPNPATDSQDPYTNYRDCQKEVYEYKVCVGRCRRLGNSSQCVKQEYSIPYEETEAGTFQEGVQMGSLSEEGMKDGYQKAEVSEEALGYDIGTEDGGWSRIGKNNGRP